MDGGPVVAVDPLSLDLFDTVSNVVNISSIKNVELSLDINALIPQTEELKVTDEPTTTYTPTYTTTNTENITNKTRISQENTEKVINSAIYTKSSIMVKAEPITATENIINNTSISMDTTQTSVAAPSVQTDNIPIRVKVEINSIPPINITDNVVINVSASPTKLETEPSLSVTTNNNSPMCISGELQPTQSLNINVTDTTPTSETLPSLLNIKRDNPPMTTTNGLDSMDISRAPSEIIDITSLDDNETMGGNVKVTQVVGGVVPKTLTKTVKWKEIESFSSPPLDIIELQDSYEIYAEIPGSNIKDIAIDLSDNKFALTGDKIEYKSPKRRREQGSPVKQEINRGRFKRVLELPEDVDIDDVDVSFEDGMLQCKIRRIEIEEEEEEKEKESDIVNVVDIDGDEEIDADQLGEPEEENDQPTKKKRGSSCVIQ